MSACPFWRHEMGLSNCNRYHCVLKEFIYNMMSCADTLHLFRPDVLELLGRVEEVVGVSLGADLPRLGLLNKVLVALLLSKVNGVVLALEVDVGALHEVTR